MLQTKTVTAELLELLNALMEIKLFRPLRLVGGTSLALQIGHRNSVDIDLFGELKLEDDFILNKTLSQFENVRLLHGTKSIKVYLINGVKVDFVNYPYQWIDNLTTIQGIRLASKCSYENSCSHSKRFKKRFY